MAQVEFTNNLINVQNALNETAVAFLYEAVAEIESQAKRNSRVNTGQTKGAWGSAVDEENLVGTVGNTRENAIWEEFGTGEYALNGNGRQGGWRYKDVNGNWHYTKGKRPNRALHKAFESKKTVVIRRARELFGEVSRN